MAANVSAQFVVQQNFETCEKIGQMCQGGLGLQWKCVRIVWGYNENVSGWSEVTMKNNGTSVEKWAKFNAVRAPHLISSPTEPYLLNILCTYTV
jgi:hypothetical protein